MTESSLVDTDLTLDRTAYQQLYSGPPERLPPASQEQLHQNVGAHIVVLTVLTSRYASSDAARAIVHAIRSIRVVRIIFGLSMDYEVLLISRIQEVYLRTGNSRQAVTEGLEQSGRLISGAAAITVVVFLGFGLAEVTIIKSLGIGLAVAISVDAFLVHQVLVPALLHLLGDHAWWAPRPLRRLYIFLGLGEPQPPLPAPAAPVAAVGEHAA